MTDPVWLVLRFEAPMVSFGGITIDQIGITRDFPAASMITGLIANALGYLRQDWKVHQILQDRLVFAARRDRSSARDRLIDTQNAQLSASDSGWTTWGYPEKRSGTSYGAPHRRFREYHPDSCVTVCLRLDPIGLDPDLAKVGTAIDHPVRPLFIGRKTCFPATPLHAGTSVRAPSAFEALKMVPTTDAEGAVPALWPIEEGPVDGNNVFRIIDLADVRNWRTGLHGGTRRVVEGTIEPNRVTS